MRTATAPSTHGNGQRTTHRSHQDSARALGDLRRSLDVTQVQLARRLAVSQATVSKFEKSNPVVSTVRRYVEALGGRLEVIAVFDDDRVLLDY